MNKKGTKKTAAKKTTKKTTKAPAQVVSLRTLVDDVCGSGSYMRMDGKSLRDRFRRAQRDDASAIGSMGHQHGSAWAFVVGSKSETEARGIITKFHANQSKRKQ